MCRSCRSRRCRATRRPSCSSSRPSSASWGRSSSTRVSKWRSSNLSSRRFWSSRATLPSSKSSISTCSCEVSQLTAVLRRIKKNINKHFRLRDFELTSRADPSKVTSPLSIFRPFLGGVHLSAASRALRTSSSFSKNFLSLIDYQAIAERIFTRTEIDRFLENLECLGFDFVRNQNSLGLVVQNRSLYSSELILGSPNASRLRPPSKRLFPAQTQSARPTLSMLRRRAPGHLSRDSLGRLRSAAHRPAVLLPDQGMLTRCACPSKSRLLSST